MLPTEAVTDTVEVRVVEPTYTIYLPLMLKNN